MIVGIVFRVMLLATLVRASIAEKEEERKMRTALAASLAGIHGALLNLSTLQSIRADIGDLLLVFGEYKNVRPLRFAGYGVLEFYLALAGGITIGAIAYYGVAMSFIVIPIKIYKNHRSYRLNFPPYRSLL